MIMSDHYSKLMIIQKKKAYNNYRFNTRNEAYAEINRGPTNKDRTYMHQMIKPNFEYLEQYGIVEYQDFILIFKKSGMVMNDIKSFINGFKNYINSQNLIRNTKNEVINWLNDRQLKKANSGEMNIILNRLSLEYPKQMYDFVQIFMQNNEKMTNNANFVQIFLGCIENLSSLKKIQF